MASHVPLWRELRRRPPPPTERPEPTPRPRSVRLDLTALAFSLMGFLGLIAVFQGLKTGVVGIPRPLYLLFLAMACAPFLTALWQTPKPVFLIAPTIALFLIYPIAAPHGIVYGRDPIFNFAFTERVATSGFWEPGTVSGLAQTYSLYPLGNTFMAFTIRTLEVPGDVAFLWVEPVLRLLALPAAVYSIGRRIFGAQVGTLGLFMYLGTASILLNIPVQQGMGIIFLSLALLALLMLAAPPSVEALRRTRILFVIVAGAIVMTHHLSSYLFAAWLIGLVAVMIGDRFRPRVLPFRLSPLAVYFVVLVGVYALTVSYRVFLVHEQSAEILAQRLASPETLPTSTTPRLGRTFAFWEVGWLGGAHLGMVALAAIAIRYYRDSRPHRFAVANAFVAAVLAILTLPLLATGTEFVPLRIGEYSNLVLGPFAAATLIRWARSRQPRWVRFVPAAERAPKSFPSATVFVVATLIFMGGNLTNQTLRPYFEEERQWSTDTPLLFGSDAIRMGTWSRAHYQNAVVWGDHSAIDIFAGFGDMQVIFGGSLVFDGPGLNETVWSGRLCLGDYVAVSERMRVYPSQWYLEPEPPVRAPLTDAEIGKFAQDLHLSLVFQDATFSVYLVVSRPPAFVPPERCR